MEKKFKLSDIPEVLEIQLLFKLADWWAEDHKDDPWREDGKEGPRPPEGNRT
jgi:hypothetical protein